MQLRRQANLTPCRCAVCYDLSLLFCQRVTWQTLHAKSQAFSPSRVEGLDLSFLRRSPQSFTLVTAQLWRQIALSASDPPGSRISTAHTTITTTIVLVR